MRIKISFFIAFAMLSLGSFAQNENTTSPYSRYGLGDITPQSFGRSAGMGGVSYGSRDKVQVNFANPASYSAIDSLSFIFEAGINGKFTNMKDNLGSQNNHNINLSYFSLSFPISHRWGAAIGLCPYADKGYELQESLSSNVLDTIQNRYLGTGTLSKFFIGNSFYITKNLSVGVNINYIFGNLSHLTYNNFSSGTSSEEAFSVETSDNTRYRNFSFEYGLQYKIELNKKKSLTLGAVYQAPFTFAAEYFQQKYRILLGTSSADTVFSVVNIPNGRVKVPGSIGVGFMYEVKDKLSVGADFKTQNWEKATFLGSKDPNLTTLRSGNVGLEYIPNKFSLKSYLAHVSYRIGARYSETYVTVNDHQIKEYGLTMGLGLPLVNATKSMHNSLMNIALEIGKRGTTSYGLLQENYAKICVSFSLYENWFIKRKFD
ncbi:MAG: hypothetical protein Q8859_03160 [Bacteroidota bacterium]|nr:hypothetical protein [Bacteroidota bacterium]